MVDSRGYKNGTKDGHRKQRKDYQNKATPEQITKNLSFALRCQRMPRVDTSDAKAVQDRINWYFEACMAEGVRPGVEGLCTALHINRATLSRWCNGIDRAGQAHQEIARDAKQILADMMEQYLMNGTINPVAGIFLASNQFDYDRNATVTVQTQPSLISAEDPKLLAEKYQADVIDVRADAPVKQLETSEADNK